MDSTQLSAFFQSLTTWPETEAALGSIASTIAQLLDASFVALQRPGREPGLDWVGWKVQGMPESRGPVTMRSDVVQWLSQAGKLFSGTTATSPSIKHLTISRGDVGVTHLTVAMICGQNRTLLAENRGAQGNSAARERIDFGWLLVGTPKALGANEEIACLAIAQKLASLAESASLEAAIQLRNQFLSIASHELKTPLTSIYGVLQLQQRMLSVKKDEPQAVQRERQESYLKMTIRQTQRLNELIDGLLDVSRIQNGRFMAEPSDTDVAVLLRDTVAGRLAVIAHEAGVRLSPEAPESLHAWVDPVRMEEVVTNLVMNAIRFSPEGGVVWIRLREEGGTIRLTVRDQGPAVPLEDRERIFQPFERAQRTARFGGLGLGLFISRQIAQLHGGSVRLAESIPGKGNVFEAAFPQRARQSAAAAS